MIGNEYARCFRDKYRRIPKAVFAAVALSLAARNLDTAGVDMSDNFDKAAKSVIREWETLHENGIITQDPKRYLKGSSA